MNCYAAQAIVRGGIVERIKVRKRQWRRDVLEPAVLPLDPRDPDVVRVKRLAERAGAGRIRRRAGDPLTSARRSADPAAETCGGG
jgi:hypothetical protein